MVHNYKPCTLCRILCLKQQSSHSCGISITNTQLIPQAWTKPSKWFDYFHSPSCKYDLRKFFSQLQENPAQKMIYASSRVVCRWQPHWRPSVLKRLYQALCFNKGWRPSVSDMGQQMVIYVVTDKGWLSLTGTPLAWPINKWCTWCMIQTSWGSCCQRNCAGTELSRFNKVHIMVTDALAHHVARTSAAIILTM